MDKSSGGGYNLKESLNYILEDQMKKLCMIASAAILAVALIAVPFSGCSRSDRAVDSSKTQLYVGTFDGGFGDEWLNTIARRFEEEYAETSFEEGKTGIQIWVAKSRNYGSTALVSLIDSQDRDIYFTEQVDYYSLLNSGKLLDISEAVTTPLTEYGEDESIADKMHAGDREFFQQDGKYYGLPFYEGTYGIYYDVDLFEDNLLYFAAEGSGDSEGFITDLSDELSAGPDGKSETTYDNGLPATYEEFFKLCDKIAALGTDYYPITWGGTVAGQYLNYFLRSLWADYEGAVQMSLNYTLSGGATNLVSSISGGEVTTYSETITEQNGYLLQKQAGRYYALDFLERLLDNTDYYDADSCFSRVLTQVDAQTDFLGGKYTSGGDTVAMYIDGTWWYNEAKNQGIFDMFSNRPGAGIDERRIGFLPLPKPDGTAAKDFTFYNAYLTECFIVSKIDPAKIDAATAFLRYCHTDEALSEFTRITYTPRAFDYALTEADEDASNYYTKSLMEVKANSEIVLPYSKNSTFLNNTTTFWRYEYIWQSEIGGAEYNYPSTAMRENNVTAEEYFNGLSAYWTESNWKNTLRLS